MQPKSPPIFQKLSNFLKVSIFIAKMRRPIIPKLLFLKKSLRNKNFELLHHYNYGFVQEYQFSPASTTPLIHYYRGRRRHHRVYSLLFSCRCVGSFGAEELEDGDCRVEEEILPAIEALDWTDEEDDSIDHKAELFIEKFYADMKMERLASI